MIQMCCVLITRSKNEEKASLLYFPMSAVFLTRDYYYHSLFGPEHEVVESQDFQTMWRLTIRLIVMKSGKQPTMTSNLAVSLRRK
jgi:hypothetical protein